MCQNYMLKLDKEKEGQYETGHCTHDTGYFFGK